MNGEVESNCQAARRVLLTFKVMSLRRAQPEGLRALLHPAPAAAARGWRPGRLRVGLGQGWRLGQVSVENRHDERGNKDLRNRKLRSKSSRPAAQWESRPWSGREGRRKARREHARVWDPPYQAIAPKCRWVAHHAQGTHFDGRAGRERGGCRDLRQVCR